ncbi:multidrug ABC transporter permease [Corynebacterium lujinxingii]|uniref:Multidrug ABC transporter permease n=1 Tax=Corynebacterium lujinxingii TaxID=2763010 RepID=A0A7H0JW91_9CORY|nr:multidrug ABC transporter permease [Corynebacterium lujinxingii]MBC3178798.1 multidrug ABC transporter permease [Corynebacterium lujinxingii]NNO11080.1 multidrug ABC transporter permease [Corynebacterium lujinxingii]QNP89307.1 multidrug ABC transporter permease [Corynebacterium lujinxingii]
MDTRLSPGTFAPAPRRASFGAMALAQGRVEAKLMLRHGEQLLVNLLIPAAVLVAAAFVPIFGDSTDFNTLVPMVFAVAATSAGFTGQAIALAFDRRYGALKRTGASGVPPWTIIVGKIMGVLATVAVQIVVLGALALVLGWRVSVAGAVFGLVALLFGVATFTAMGLLMGGTLSSELVLALANLIWIAFMGIVGWVVYSGELANAGWWNLVPTVALAGALAEAVELRFNALAWISLAVWAAVAVVGAVRLFRFDD